MYTNKYSTVYIYINTVQTNTHNNIYNNKKEKKKKKNTHFNK